MADAQGILEAREAHEVKVSCDPAYKKPIKGMDHLDWGMRNRLSRLIKADGRTQFLPIDHGYFQGPTRCLECPGETIKDLLPYADGLFVTRGVLRAAISPDLDAPIILRVSGGSSVVGADLADEIITTSIEEMIRLNVAAVGLSVFVGSDYERQTLENLAELVSQCEDHGIPVMAVTAVGKELDKRTSRYLGLACRVCAELGAKVVKTYYCEDGFEKVVQGCPVPVVIAGGPKTDNEREVFDFVYDGLQKGAIGVNLGRNIWQHARPLPMMRALNGVIHGGLTPTQAQELFDELCHACAA
jgi:putative autoinducer-2 (AI-2) aldolase